eukprot:Opistho-2@19158
MQSNPATLWPAARHSHAAAAWRNSLIVVGGVTYAGVTSETWLYNATVGTWVSLPPCPIAMAGHTATFGSGNILYVIGGYSVAQGYGKTVYTFSTVSRTWSSFKPSGVPMRGTFGHTATYHRQTNSIFVHGGGRPSPRGASKPSSDLYALSITNGTYRKLKPSPSLRYLHGSFIVGDFLVSLGGSGFSVPSAIDACMSPDAFVYDMLADSWSPYAAASIPGRRFGYATAADPSSDSVFLSGGFDGVAMDGVIRFTLPNCTALPATFSACDTATGGLCRVCASSDGTNVTCSPAWSRAFPSSACAARSSSLPISMSRAPTSTSVPQIAARTYDLCLVRTTCQDCLNATLFYANVANAPTGPYESCAWCAATQSCRMESLARAQDALGCGVFSVDRCRADGAIDTSCASAKTYDDCIAREGCASPIDICVADPRRISCSSQQSCEACLSQPSQICMWCASTGTCIDPEAYPTTMPFGQCTRWYGYSPAQCKDVCADIIDCATCNTHPECGWCENSNGRGTGTCSRGSVFGPSPTSQSCHSNRWFYGSCPRCQCNGHSDCGASGSTCLACDGNTQGPQCERCNTDFFGLPRNGGTCRPCAILSTGICTACNSTTGGCTHCTNGGSGPSCETCPVGSYRSGTDCVPCHCNGGSSDCNVVTGVCSLCLPGYTGSHCMECTDQFMSDPLYNGTCYMSLEMNTRYIMNETRGAFAFRNIRSDIALTISMSVLDKPGGVAVRRDDSRDHSHDDSRDDRRTIEDFISIKILGVANGPVPVFRTIISQSFLKLFSYTVDDGAYDFSRSIFVTFQSERHVLFSLAATQVSEPLNLVQFFATFFACFFSLLFIAFIVWRIKTRYDRFRAARDRIVELRIMATRPAASVLIVDLFDPSHLSKTAVSTPSLRFGCTRDITNRNKNDNNNNNNSNKKKSSSKNSNNKSNNPSSNTARGESDCPPGPLPVAVEFDAGNEAAIAAFVIDRPAREPRERVVSLGWTLVACPSACAWMSTSQEGQMK